MTMEPRSLILLSALLTCGACERVDYHKLELSVDDFATLSEVPVRGSTPDWILATEDYTVHIDQTSRVGHVRAHLVVANNTWQPGSDSSDRHYYFSVDDFSFRTSTTGHFKDLGVSLDIFNPAYRKFDARDLIADEPPGIAAVFAVQPCLNEGGWLYLEIFGPGGETIGEHRLYLKLSDYRWDWRTIADPFFGETETL